MPHNPNTKNKFAVNGQMKLQIIPAKDGAFRTHEPMLTLSFKVDNGPELTLFVEETEQARQLFDHWKSQMSGPAGWISPLTRG